MTKPKKDKEQKTRPSGENMKGRKESSTKRGAGEPKGKNEQEQDEKILNQDDRITNNEPYGKNISF